MAALENLSGPEDAPLPPSPGFPQLPSLADLNAPSDRLIWRGDYTCRRAAITSELVLLRPEVGTGPAFLTTTVDPNSGGRIGAPVGRVDYQLAYDATLEIARLMPSGSSSARAGQVGSQPLDILFQDEQLTITGSLEPGCPFTLTRMTEDPGLVAARHQLAREQAGFRPDQRLNEAFGNEDKACLALAAWAIQVELGASGRDLARSVGSDPESRLFLASVLHPSLTAAYLGPDVTQLPQDGRTSGQTVRWGSANAACITNPSYRDHGAVFKNVFKPIFDHLSNMRTDLDRLVALQQKADRVAQLGERFPEDRSGLDRITAVMREMQGEAKGALTQVQELWLAPVRARQLAIAGRMLQTELDAPTPPSSQDQLQALEASLRAIQQTLAFGAPAAGSAAAEAPAETAVAAQLAAVERKQGALAATVAGALAQQVAALPPDYASRTVVEAQVTAMERLARFLAPADRAATQAALDRKLDEILAVELQRDAASFGQEERSLAGLAQNTARFRTFEQKYQPYLARPVVAQMTESYFAARDVVAAGAAPEFVAQLDAVQAQDNPPDAFGRLNAVLPFARDKSLKAYAPYSAATEQHAALARERTAAKARVEAELKARDEAAARDRADAQKRADAQVPPAVAAGAWHLELVEDPIKDGRNPIAVLRASRTQGGAPAGTELQLQCSGGTFTVFLEFPGVQLAQITDEGGAPITEVVARFDDQAPRRLVWAMKDAPGLVGNINPDVTRVFQSVIDLNAILVPSTRGQLVDWTYGMFAQWLAATRQLVVRADPTSGQPTAWFDTDGAQEAIAFVARNC